MLPSTLSLISAIFAPQVRPRIIARWATTSGIALASGPVLSGLIEGPRFGWSSSEILIALFVGVLALATFISVEHRIKHPMFFGRMLFFSTMLLVPRYLTFVEKHPAGDVGLLLAIPAVVFSLTMARMSALCSRFGDKRMLIAAALILMTPGTSVMPAAPRRPTRSPARSARRWAWRSSERCVASVYGAAVEKTLDGDLKANTLAQIAQSPANAEDIAGTLAGAAAAQVDVAVIAGLRFGFSTAMIVCAAIALATASTVFNHVPGPPAEPAQQPANG